MDVTFQEQVMKLGCCWSLVPNLGFTSASNLSSILKLIWMLNPSLN